MSNVDDLFIREAYYVAERATCDRKHVGCVIVQDRSILSSGWNTSPKGSPTCDQAGHIMVNGSCVRTVHAEVMAIGRAARWGDRLHMSTSYQTVLPCYNCLKLLHTAGVYRVVYAEDYDVKLWGWPVPLNEDGTVEGFQRIQVVKWKGSQP